MMILMPALVLLGTAFALAAALGALSFVSRWGTGYRPATRGSCPRRAHTA